MDRKTKHLDEKGNNIARETKNLTHLVNIFFCFCRPHFVITAAAAKPPRALFIMPTSINVQLQLHKVFMLIRVFELKAERGRDKRRPEEKREKWSHRSFN